MKLVPIDSNWDQAYDIDLLVWWLNKISHPGSGSMATDGTRPNNQMGEGDLYSFLPFWRIPSSADSFPVPLPFSSNFITSSFYF